jgi:mono/diheme cytochrome c family protein
MQLTRWMVTLGAAGVLALAGCGGDDEDSGGAPAGGETGTAQETPTPAEGGAGGAGGEARDMFANTCGGCHTLQAAATTGTIGPNLDDLKPDKEQVLNAIRTGPGQMPENLFRGADAEAVAEFVSSSAGG